MLQVQDHSLRPLTTAHLAQTMSLLTLSNLELRDRVMAEIAANPALEMVDDRVCPSCHRRLTAAGPCPACSSRAADDNLVVFLSPRESHRPSKSASLDETPPEMEPAAPEDLALHVLGQLAGQLKEDDRPLAAFVLSSLDEEGFLQDPPAIIARTNRASLDQVERVLSLISHADPPGLATMGPRQALLAQLDLLDQDDPAVLLARRLLQEHFSELGRREFERMAQATGVNVAKVKQAANLIHDKLTPYPARAFWRSGRQAAPADPNVYHTPDIQISNNPNGDESMLVVEIFAPLSGWLRVNPLFRQSLPEAEEEQSEAWTRHLERASLFVKCLQQRNNTMRRLMQALVARQRDFIRHGDRHLAPITRAGIATEIGVHESTVSRAVSHKSVALPDGRIIPLTRFFDRSLSVRDRIKEIVDGEPQPLTDDEIAAMLRKDGVRVARRTVAKYRAIEGILPARLRHAREMQPAPA
jgi:RNA polymerase sigma-54 factor